MGMDDVTKELTALIGAVTQLLSMPPAGRDLDALITEEDAAQFLRHDIRTIQRWRYEGGGPIFVRVSRNSVRYRRRDLISWTEARLVASTSQKSAA